MPNPKTNLATMSSQRSSQVRVAHKLGGLGIYICLLFMNRVQLVRLPVHPTAKYLTICPLIDFLKFLILTESSQYIYCDLIYVNVNCKLIRLTMYEDRVWQLALRTSGLLTKIHVVPYGTTVKTRFCTKPQLQ